MNILRRYIMPAAVGMAFEIGKMERTGTWCFSKSIAEFYFIKGGKLHVLPLESYGADPYVVPYKDAHLVNAMEEFGKTLVLFKDDGTEVEPGSDDIGMVANGGPAPIGYYKDPVKSAATFRVIDGHRYSFPGDYAKIAADGTLILLGRGSA